MSNRKDIAKEALWRKGILHWKLDKVQKQLYDLYYSTTSKVLTWVLARRSGKTYTLFILALEQCLKKPNSIVKFVSPTKTQVNTILRPLVKKILEDCPEDIRPEFKEKDYIYYFPNGSEIQLAGSDNQHAERLRGGDSHIAIIDEAGTCSELRYLLRDILLPTTLMTRGKIILASTPPGDYEHDFIGIMEEAEARGTLIKKTIYDNPRLTQEQIDESILECGGINTDTFKREYLCQVLKDENTSVIPEFTDKLQSEIVKDWPKPPFYDSYESVDFGGKDLTVVLFGYYDFRADKVIVEDELVVDFQNQDVHIKSLVDQIREKETALWTNVLTNETKKPYLRVSDINYIATNEFYKASNGEIVFQPAKKDDNDAAIHNLRVMLSNKKIIIHPRCVTLIRHLRNVKWFSPKNKSKFARSKDNGHYDAVEALKYMIRHIVYTKNPYPAGYGLNMKDLYVNNPEKFQNQQINIYKQIFNQRKPDKGKVPYVSKLKHGIER
jgi:hypothetical protein